jgi:phosphate:Na+ symporter
LKDIETGKYSYQLGVFYMDFINHCEKLADHVINVVETLFLKDKE